MSTQVNTYAIIGCFVPYDDVSTRYDELEPYMDSAYEGIQHHDDLCILFDGMSGKYAIVGRVLAKTENHQGLEAPVTFPILDNEERSRLLVKIKDLFPDKPAELRHIVVSHYR